MESVVSFMLMVQRGSDHFVNILLIGWWWSKWESASSNFSFQLGSSGLRIACHHWSSLISPTWGVSVSAKQLKDIVLCTLWWGARTLPQGCTIVSPDCLLLPVSHPSLPWLTIVWICTLELREGHGGWMKAVSCNQRNGGQRKALCPGAP